MVVQACNSSYLEGTNRRILSWRPAWGQVVARSYFKNEIKRKKKKGWRWVA
jgi:hypothetical protein